MIGMLSINNDTVVETPVNSDPILGATLNFPKFQFTGFTTTGELAIFWPDIDASFTMTKGGETFEQSVFSVLFFVVDENLFWGALSDTTLAGMSPGSHFYNSELSDISSPFLDSLNSVLNPSSPDFDPFSDFFVSITPDQDFMTLTENFTKFGATGGSDFHFVAKPVPEPSYWLLLVTGFIGLLTNSWRRQQEGSEKKDFSIDIVHIKA